MQALTELDAAAARTASNMKEEINSMERAAASHQADRLLADAPDRIANYRFEIDVIANLKRVYYFSKRIAREAVPRPERSSI
jgi:Na+/phosphate symporter